MYSFIQNSYIFFFFFFLQICNTISSSFKFYNLVYSFGLHTREGQLTQHNVKFCVFTAKDTRIINKKKNKKKPNPKCTPKAIMSNFFLHKMQMSVHVLHQYSFYKLYSSIVEEGGLYLGNRSI